MSKQIVTALLEAEKAKHEAEIQALKTQLEAERSKHEAYMTFYGESLRAIRWTLNQMQGQPLSEKLMKVYRELERHTAKEVAIKIFEQIRQEHGTEIN
jgi:Skp family chaperone for outer membrane proteins